MSSISVKRTGARPKLVDGRTFHCYRVAILRYEWRDEDGLVTVFADRRSFRVAANGYMLVPRFRTIEGAMRAGLRATQ